MREYLMEIMHFLHRKKFAFVLFVGLLLAIIYLGVAKLEVDRSIYSVFPKGEKYEALHEVLENKEIYKKIIFSINVEGADYEALIRKLDTAKSFIEENTKNYVTKVETTNEIDPNQILNYYYTYLPVFLDSNDYIGIEKMLTKDSVESSMQGLIKQISSFSSFATNGFVSKDPLGIFWHQMREINPIQNDTNFIIEDGLVYSNNKSQVIFTADINLGLNDELKNLELEKRLTKCQKHLEMKGIKLNYFAPFLISNVNTRQVKSDTTLIISLAISLILILLIVYYRSVILPLIFLLLVGLSAFMGLGLTGLIQTEISAVSIAISAVLLGIVMDYFFHFFTHFTHTGNVSKTVKELAKPLLIGSFTTIAAFASLLFTESVILQDFGLLALLTLFSALFVTLFILPLFISIFSFKLNQRKEGKEIKFPKWLIRIALYSTVILTAWFIVDQPEINFDSDLNNLSYHPKELKVRENYITGLNPVKSKKVLLLVKSREEEEAIKFNFLLNKKLLEIKANGELEKIISTAPYLIPDSIFYQKQNEWISFWQTNQPSTRTNINTAASNLGFKPNAFNPFFDWISLPVKLEVNKGKELVDELNLSSLLSKNKEEYKILTTVILQKKYFQNLKSNLAELPYVTVIDSSEIADSLLSSVQADFNYLILFSSLLVFISLLLVYGRLELALFSFFPMGISWIWIIYLSNWFNINFNFVNIMLATIIFGLGDDFSIFVTDGLLKKYRSGINVLENYKSAILLSAGTTIIGTGVLVFAKHPAINSIALLSVSGILTILLLTIVLQPYLFDLFVTKRTNKGFSPMTFLGMIYTSFLYSYFIIGCLLLTGLIPILILLPLSKLKKRRVVTYIASKMAASTLFLGFHIKMRTRDKEKFDFNKPAIYISNHISFLDILHTLKLSSKIVIMVNDWVYNSPLFGLVVRYSGYIYIKKGAEENLKLIRNRLDEGYSIMIFPEGTRNSKGEIQRFHKGAFYLAQELKVDIQPILFVGVEFVNPKGDLIIKSGSIIVQVLDRIKSSDQLFQKRLGLMSKEIKSMMEKELEMSRKREYTADFFRKRVGYNYLYKGPVLEWYVKIKWSLEKSNFSFYDNLIAERKRIYDLGCGYGYLSYFLHYRDAGRKIEAIDYDENKIEIAKSGYDKTHNLTFECRDIKACRFQVYDVVFLNDVLHYMNKDDRRALLDVLYEKLNKNGIIVIREGVKDYVKRHKKTMLSERFSTRLLKFNKVENDLDFINIKEIHEFAESTNLNFEIVEHSTQLSNLTFVLRKQ